ncbi:MAG: hypothetical protein Q8M20_17955 [Rhodocyclaceae bacterium]|nr:hypothetical protein [Rhodocyclaceae bacterium]
MSKVFIILEDAGTGIDVKGLTQHPTEHPEDADLTPAEQLGEFLKTAAQVWLETQHMDTPRALAYVQALANHDARGLH